MFSGTLFCVLAILDGTTANAVFQRYDEAELERDRIEAVVESWVTAMRAAAT